MKNTLSCAAVAIAFTLMACDHVVLGFVLLFSLLIALAPTRKASARDKQFWKAMFVAYLVIVALTAAINDHAGTTFSLMLLALVIVAPASNRTIAATRQH